MKKYLTSHMERPYTTIPDPGEFEAFLKKHPDRSTVVGFFASLTLSAFPNFVEAGEQKNVWNKVFSRYLCIQCLWI